MTKASPTRKLKRIKKKLDKPRKKMTEEQLKEALKKVKVRKEITEGCEHKKLNQVIQGSAWYQCKKCKFIFFLRDIPGWKPEAFRELMKMLIKKIKW